MKMEQSVPKRRHIKFRGRGITQKKAYNNKYFLPIYNYTYGALREKSYSKTYLNFNHIYTLGKLVITNNTYHYVPYTYSELKERTFLEDRT
jgi:hypothetical protein